MFTIDTFNLGSHLGEKSGLEASDGGAIINQLGGREPGRWHKLRFGRQHLLEQRRRGPDPGGLRDNGGPTQTFALVAGSRAIDWGIEAVCADASTVSGRDQRGEPRPCEW